MGRFGGGSSGIIRHGCHLLQEPAGIPHRGEFYDDRVLFILPSLYLPHMILERFCGIPIQDFRFALDHHTMLCVLVIDNIVALLFFSRFVTFLARLLDGT